MRSRTIPLLILCALLCATSCDLQKLKDKIPSSTSGDTAFSFQDPSIAESSGLAASRQHPGIFWTHNDSGGQAVLYAVDGADGQTKAKITLAGVTAVDWEAIALGTDQHGNPAIYVGDIGDNSLQRRNVVIHRIPEPSSLVDATVKSEVCTATYADGPRDAEALLVDPQDGTVYVASKEVTANLYRLSPSFRDKGAGEFQRVAAAPPLTTDGAFAPDGSRFVLRTYATADLYARGPGPHIAAVRIPVQAQGESVTFGADGGSLFLGSEGAHSAVKRVAVTG